MIALELMQKGCWNRNLSVGGILVAAAAAVVVVVVPKLAAAGKVGVAVGESIPPVGPVVEPVVTVPVEPLVVDASTPVAVACIAPLRGSITSLGDKQRLSHLHSFLLSLLLVWIERRKLRNHRSELWLQLVLKLS